MASFSNLSPLMLKYLFSILCFLFIAPAAHAWNKAGHMVTGAIAYQVLKAETPEAIPKIVALLKAHPSYEQYWAKQLAKLAEEDRDEALFMIAARWADDIRNIKEFDHPTWHYINIPYKPAGEPETLETAPPLPVNILTALHSNLDIASGKGPEDQRTPAARALAASWLFHLTGDVHQPLHAVTLFTREFRIPAGDRGGTFFFIRPKPDAKAITLHKLWDDLLLGTDDFRDARNTATEIRLDKELAKEKLTELKEADLEKWASVESFTTAKEKVYAFNGQMISGAKAGGAEAPVLPEGYLAQAKQIAHRRAALAGYRLAEMLRKLP